LAYVAAEQVAKAATLAKVAAIGRAAKARIAAWGALTILVSPLDVAVYEAARRAYSRLDRVAQAATAVTQAEAIVAEWEGMSHSDRAIDAGRGGLTAYYEANDALISQRAA